MFLVPVMHMGGQDYCRRLNTNSVQFLHTTHALVHSFKTFVTAVRTAQVYNIMNAVAENDDEHVLEDQLRSHVGDRGMHYLCLIAQRECRFRPLNVLCRFRLFKV